MHDLKYVFLALLFVLPQLAQADWKDVLSDLKKTVEETAENPRDVSLSEDTIAAGLKEALNQGIGKSVEQLGKNDGFLKDASVKIPMPKTLMKIDEGLRSMGQAKVADQFIETMNHAAEEAVPKTVDIMVGAVKAMTLKDAVEILNGEPDAATQYFKHSSLSDLRGAIKPIIQQATGSVGLTRVYKEMMSKAGFLAKFVDKDSLDIDQYVTNKAIDGLLVKVSAEERRIRKDPVARTSDLLKKVFSN